MADHTIPTIPTIRAQRISRRSRPAADWLNILIATAQRTVLQAERQARDFGCPDEEAALKTARAHLFDVDWCCTEAEIAAEVPPETYGDQKWTAEPAELPTDVEEALRALLARELDEREEAAGGTGICAFARAAGIGFREALDYARGRKFVAGNAKRSHLSLEKAQAVARALGYRLQLVQAD